MAKTFTYNRLLLGGFTPVIIVCIMLGACREKYTAVVKDVNLNYMVIDGFINTGGDSTIIKLSRAFKLDNKALSAPERGAVVLVETDGGASYALPELALKPGVYAIPTVGTDHTKKYRLRVRTKDNREYLSDFVESKVSPPVELTHDFRKGNLNVYANTQDATGKSRYYNYTYTESWQYRSKIKSLWKVENHQMVRRQFPKDDIYNCYQTIPSGNITIASTAGLGEDRLADYPVVFVLPSSDKVRIEYSVLIKQTVLTRAGFEFAETMQKNTQKIGSIFDSQPSQLFGNIKCTTNPTEVVIGFVSAGTITENRLLLIANDMPFTFVGPLPDSGCIKLVSDLLFRNQYGEDDVKRYLTEPTNPEYLPVDEILVMGRLLGYTATRNQDCVDCRLQGGSSIAPPYWK